MPVFAALDGTVLAAHDGELDQNVTNLVGRPSNFVTLSHAGGYRTSYVHFKQGSVAVSVGQSVRAGTQLGLTGSSGNSSWPHLHFESQFSTASAIPRALSWYSRTVSLTMTGSWNMDVYANGVHVATAPFMVVSTAAEIVNRPPLAIQSLALDPAAPASFDVPFCRVTPTSLYRRDPDYDLVRYRYRWEINGVAIREVVTAALSDAIPRGVLGPGDRLTCVVTPLDDSTAGPSASISTAPLGTSGPPAGLTGSSTGSSVLLSWQAPASAATPTTFVIEAGSSSGLTDLASVATGTTATTFSATGVPSGTYFVRVRAANPAGPGPPSNEILLIVGASGGAPCTAAPAAPTGLSASSATGGTVALVWNGAIGNPGSYLIEVGSGPGASDLMNSDLGSGATTLMATGVGRGHYYMRIRGRNGCGVGPASNEVALVVP